MTDAEAQAFTAVRARLLGGIGKAGKGYYAQAAFKVRPMAAEGLGTWAVDAHWRIYIDPANLPGGEAGWDVAQATEVFEHELNHLLRDHALRLEAHAGKDRDPQKSNIAADLEINDDLDPEGFVAEIGVTPAKYQLESNKTAEWYYDNLPQQDENDSENGGDGSQGDSDDNGGGKQSSKGQANCGSGAGGNPIDGELDPDDADAPGMSQGEANIVRKATAQAVKEHEQTHGRGTVAGGLSQWADAELAPPTVPWQRVLAAAVRRGVRIVAGQQNHTYTRMSRRSSAVPNVALPAMYSPKPRISVILDTSGSMSNSMVTEALSEIDGIAKALGCQGDDLTLIQVDAAVGSVKPWQGGKSVEINGRGGTDMRVGFDAAEELRNPSNVVICLTDGESPFPERRPRNGASVIVGIIGTPQQRAYNMEYVRNAMPWAQVVEIGNDKD